jgi:L-asparaginase
MKRILLLQTGGTISMQFEKNGVTLDPAKWSQVLYQQMPELTQIADITIENVFFEDSSDINPAHWRILGDLIYNRVQDYDGFVVLHGTDTMAYTASALSFALNPVNKPVILTGSQVPMSKIRSDARRNLINAVELATYPIHEVAVCFNDHLFRGNRSTKMSIGDFNAFESPNFPPLAEIGINIKLSDSVIKNGSVPTECNTIFNDAIHVIKVHPAINTRTLGCLDLSTFRAVIIEAFGIGNLPVKGPYSMLPFIKKCREHHCHIIITSQAAYDSVNLDIYSSGRAIKELGGLSAGEMTMEAAITKTMHLLGQNLAEEKFNLKFMSNLAGERSVTESISSKY